MSLYKQNIGRMPRWLKDWIEVNESQKQELGIKSAVAEENCELIYNKICYASIKLEITCQGQAW